MTVSVPLVVILGAVVFVAYRYMGLRVWHAVVTLIFGFYLASTDIAPQINNLVAAILGWASSGHPHR